MLKTRIGTVAVLLPAFAAALFYLPMAGWALFLGPLVLMGAWEWGALAGWRVSGRVAYAFVIATAGGLLWQFGLRPEHSVAWLSQAIFAVALLFWLAVAPLWLAQGWRAQTPLIMAVTGAVVLLPTWGALIQLQVKPAQLLMLMAIVWISDSVAYFCGRQWGHRKLAVSISPGKTWEGVFGALAGVALYFGLVSAAGVAEHSALHGFSGLAIFLWVAVLGIEGDLFESWIKRTAGVKDSGVAFPGHGGVLDRIDALTSSMPAAALLLAAFA